MKKLLPLLLLVLGLGGGVGAGLALAPPEPEAAEACAAPVDGREASHGEPAGGQDGAHGAAEAHGADGVPEAAPCGQEAEAAGGQTASDEAPADAHGGSGHGEATVGAHDYVKLPNQFIVPVVEGGEVAALMLLSLSVEVPAGARDGIAPIEPKLRDSFLQVLFDHANTGGFGGMFTASAAMRPLRAALLDAAEAASGGLVTDVLIVDMVREDR